MTTSRMTARWRDEPIRPQSYEDVAALVGLARKVRDRIVDFDWELSQEDLCRLREAVHSWGTAVQGRYKKLGPRQNVWANLT